MLVLDKNLSWLWFETVRLLSQQYGLPDPLLILQSPPTHYYWKKLTKLMVFDWWPTKFRSEIDLSWILPVNCNSSSLLICLYPALILCWPLLVVLLRSERHPSLQECCLVRTEPTILPDISQKLILEAYVDSQVVTMKWVLSSLFFWLVQSSQMQEPRPFSTGHLPWSLDHGYFHLLTTTA